MQRKTDLAAVEERQRWDRAAEEREKRANVRLDANVPGSREKVAREAVAARSGQEGSVVVIENSVASAFGVAAGATPVDDSSVQITGDVRYQRSTECAGAHREEEDEVAVVAASVGGQGSAAVAHAVAVGALVQAGDDAIEKVEKIIKKMKVGNLVLHCKLVAEKTAHAYVLLDKVRLQRDVKKLLRKRRRLCGCWLLSKPSEKIARLESSSKELSWLSR